MASTRRRTWADTNLSLTLVSDAVQEINLLTNVLPSDTKTAVRIIGRLIACPASLTAQVQGGMRIDIGIGVATEEAFGVGGASLPNPSLPANQPARGWLYKTTMTCIKEHDSGTTNEFTFVDVLHFDVRAMRKVDRGILFLGIESDSFVGSAFDVDLIGTIRVLCLT